MIPAEALKPGSQTAYAAKTYQPSKFSAKSTPALSTLFDMTFQAVEMDGSNLWRESEEVLVGQLVEAVRLADLRQKSELNINNITPWVKIGEQQTGQVANVQKNIQTALVVACNKLNRVAPECRLNLYRGEFGIRAYMGRGKPTDFVFEEDLISDSR